MLFQKDVSRRSVLEFAGAAAALTFVRGSGVAQAQGRRIEQLAPELDKIISTSEPIQEIASGFGGDLGPTEGPVWWKEGGYLLFSDIHNNRRMKYTPGQGVSVFKEPTNRANGLTRDLQGRLLAAEHDSRRVTRQEADGSITVIVSIDQTMSSCAPTAPSTSPTRLVRQFPSSGTFNIRASTVSLPISGR
jgi:hypothetical protein